MVTLNFPVYFSNISDTAPNASFTIAQPSLSSASKTTFLFLLEEIGISLFLQFFVLYSRDSDVNDLGLLCLLINEDDLRPTAPHYNVASRIYVGLTCYVNAAC